MLGILTIVLLCNIPTAFLSCGKYYAIESDLPEDKLKLIVSDFGGTVIGKLPFANVYEISSPQCLDDVQLPYGLHRRAKRSIESFEDNIRSHPQIQDVKKQEILNIEKRFKFRASEFSELVVSSMKPTKLPKEMHTESDEDFNRQYVEYAGKIRSAVNFNDPAAKYTWQYLNDGKSVSPLAGLDINLYPIFMENITGVGSNVVILDDGLDITHPDLAENYDPTISINMDRPEANGLSPRGPRAIMPDEEGHGTRCAGLVAAVANNSICSHGVAPKTKIGGIRILTGEVTDILEARGLSYQSDLINVYCSSWGPTDDGIMMDLPHEFAEKAINHGLEKGRNGLGSIYVFASGNGGLFGDNCGADGFISSPNVIAVSAVDNVGRKTLYSEACASVRVSIPIGGTPSFFSSDFLPTSMENGKCDGAFVGTSAAAPVFAGCIALALEVNPKLTWRDISHLLPWSSRIPNPIDGGWTVNSAGILHNPYFGYGTIDCYRMVKLAKQWNSVGPLCVSTHDNYVYNMSTEWGRLQPQIKKEVPDLFQCNESCVAEISEEYETYYEKSWAIKSQAETIISLNVTNSDGVTKYSLPQNIPENTPCHVDIVEQVIIDVKWKHSCRGSLEFNLTSPSGASSMLLGHRKRDTYTGEGSMLFASAAHWGEKVTGMWKLIIHDRGLCSGKQSPANTTSGFITGISIKFRGTSENDSGFIKNKNMLEPLLTKVGKAAVGSQTSHILSPQEIKDTFNEQRFSSLHHSQQIFQ
ncbi:unnamed protein product [Trichobilharzia szidati]|nr:unnamed protein product [Trichobilharzia szidati]